MGWEFNKPKIVTDNSQALINALAEIDRLKARIAELYAERDRRAQAEKGAV